MRCQTPDPRVLTLSGHYQHIEIVAGGLLQGAHFSADQVHLVQTCDLAKSRRPEMSPPFVEFRAEVGASEREVHA